MAHVAGCLLWAQQSSWGRCGGTSLCALEHGTAQIPNTELPESPWGPMQGGWPESLLGNKCTQQQGLQQLDAYISVGISSNPISAFCRKLSFSRPAKPKGLRKAGCIYLDAEKWVPAECFLGPIRAAALCSSACHSVRSALSSCQNKSCGTKLSAP